MISSRYFGTLSTGEPIYEYILTNSSGNYVSVLNYGCRIRCIQVFGVDVCLGFDTIQEYENDTISMGAVVGRYANRIEKARFTLNGKTHHVAANDGPNHLHGGICGFSKKVWDSEIRENSLVLSRISPDGEENYPGTLHVTITYSFSDENTLAISYAAETEADTILNLTNHAYFNLNGSGSAMEHFLTIYSDAITEINNEVLPTGKYLPVDNTPFDFRTSKTICQDIETDTEQMIYGHGYDHNFVLSKFPVAAILTGDISGISMEVITDQPGMQLYTGNFIRPGIGKKGVPFQRRNAVCLETQGFPNAMEHSHFPSPILRAGDSFLSETKFHFFK